MKSCVNWFPLTEKLRENCKVFPCIRQKSVCPAPISTMIVLSELSDSVLRATVAMANIDGITADGEIPMPLSVSM